MHVYIYGRVLQCSADVLVRHCNADEDVRVTRAGQEAHATLYI